MLRAKILSKMSERIDRSLILKATKILKRFNLGFLFLILRYIIIKSEIKP